MHIHWLDEVGQVIALNSPVMFPAISWNTLSTYQRIYLLTVPLEYVDLYGDFVSEALFGIPLTYIQVNKLLLQLEQDMIKNALEDKNLYHESTKDQWQNLLKVLRVQ